MANHTATTSARWRGTILALALAAAAGAIAYFVQPSRDAAVSESMLPTTLPASSPSRVARIAAEARDLKLITWSFETEVDAQSVSDRWYGDAVASVRAPVRYLYGVDLATLKEDAIFRDASTGTLTFVVDPPKRLSVEIELERLEQSLKTSGLRWRSRNQDQLDDTRAKLGTVAKSLVLSKADDQRMREISRQQIETHLQRVLMPIDPAAVVSVKFSN